MTSLKSHRSSGILLHPTSLPGPFGIGDLGNEAHAFVDFLATSSQSLWQMLPLGPTGFGNSPYQSFSAFAGNPLLIGPEQLIGDGLLDQGDVADQAFPQDYVDFDSVRTFKEKLLRRAFQNYKRSNSLKEQFLVFCEDSSWWLEDYALFRALKNKYGGREWTAWDPELAHRNAAAITKAQKELEEEIEAQKFFQFLFFHQWKLLRDYSHGFNVNFIGDVPIFVAHDSADVWAHPEYFKLDETGKPTVVAGVPPDYFSETGQLWGNPPYDWDKMRHDDFQWWIDRMRFALEIFDVVRIDHFRGFAACWEIPAGDKTAQNGQWVPTPGRELFAALKKTSYDLRIIAENLGVITPDVEGLLEEFGFPGMRVLQFAFADDASNDHLPHSYQPNTVAYTATHDNDTTVGWFSSLSNDAKRLRERAFCLRYLNADGTEIHWDMIRAVIASVAETAIIPLQDLLGLGSQARMNLPASNSGNWKWRFKLEDLGEDTAERFSEMTKTYGRARID